MKTGLHHRRLRAFVALSVVCAGVLSVVNAGAAPGGGTLFGTDAAFGNLIAIDTETGAGTVVGFMGIGSVPSLAVDPTTGTMFAGRGAGAPDIFTVNTATGAASFVGSSGLGFAAIGGLDFRLNGQLYAAVNLAGDGGTGSDHLARIDKTTGAATVVGPFGTCSGVSVPTFGAGSCAIEGIEAIAFDKRGVLWGALSARGAAGTPGLYRINTNTGTATFVAPLAHKDTGLPPSGGVVSLQFDCEGDLFGGTATPIGGASDGGMLIELNKRGRFRFAGRATAGNSLGALAFGGQCVTG